MRRPAFWPCARLLRFCFQELVFLGVPLAGVEEEAVELFYSVKVSPGPPSAPLRSSKFSVSKSKLLVMPLASVEEEVVERVEPI